MIGKRIESILGLSGRFDWLSAQEVQIHLGGLHRFLEPMTPSGYTEPKRFDARDTNTTALADWLRALGIEDQRVRVYWLSQQAGISINYYDFLRFLEELWYPSSDDVVVESHVKSFVIVIDHEEQVQLFLRKCNATDK